MVVRGVRAIRADAIPVEGWLPRKGITRSPLMFVGSVSRARCWRRPDESEDAAGVTGTAHGAITFAPRLG